MVYAAALEPLAPAMPSPNKAAIAVVFSVLANIFFLLL
jgi:hypothetical protein